MTVEYYSDFMYKNKIEKLPDLSYETNIGSYILIKIFLENNFKNII